MPALILISGAGQLGSRYLQGMINCNSPLRIYVHDCHENSLSLAKQRWDEVANVNNIHNVSYHTSLQGLPRRIDIAIVSTTADVRATVVENIGKKIDVNYWVLEKVLAQNEYDLDKLMSSINVRSTAWVNTPRRMMSWHKKIKKQLDCSSPMKFKVKGGSWGLACNAVHFLDLFSCWTGELLQNVYTEGLNDHWFESKRANYWEVSGVLEARFSGGSIATLHSEESNETVLITILNNHSWKINEAEGFAKRSDGIAVYGNLNFQSEMTAALIQSILEHGCCELPLLEESTELHRVFIRSMYQHWKKAGNPTATYVPIT